MGGDAIEWRGVHLTDNFQIMLLIIKSGSLISKVITFKDSKIH